MAFVNEYIPESDYEKYDLRRICAGYNRVDKDHMYSDHWTIDRARDAFLIKIWSHRDSAFSGYAFYWKGEWILFEMRLTGADENRPDGSCWFGYLVKNFFLPEHLIEMNEEILTDLHQALSDYCGVGVFSKCTHCIASVDFIEE
jgi:hypothetical protein